MNFDRKTLRQNCNVATTLTSSCRTFFGDQVFMAYRQFCIKMQAMTFHAAENKPAYMPRPGRDKSRHEVN